MVLVHGRKSHSRSHWNSHISLVSININSNLLVLLESLTTLFIELLLALIGMSSTLVKQISMVSLIIWIRTMKKSYLLEELESLTYWSHWKFH